MTGPKLVLADGGPEDLASLATDAIVFGTLAGDGGVELAPGAEALDKALGGELATVLADLGATGKADEVVRVPTFGKLTAPVLLASGLGKPHADGAVAPEQVRRASGAAARALAGKAGAVSVLSAIDLAAAVEGTVLGAYTFTEYRSGAKPSSGRKNGKRDGNGPVGKVAVLAPEGGKPKQHRATLRAATAIAEAVCDARDLVNTPPNDLFPAAFAERARALGEAVGLDVEVLDEKALRKKGFGGIVGVGSGSSRPPRLVRMRHRGGRSRAKVALVGKGITFDTGGISLKPPPGMEDMTSDMSGAAAMVASVVLAAKLNYPLEVTATVPMAENMPGGNAYRPGDVLHMYKGTTVEVLNTDAEGRLILADGIARACEDEPDYLIEASTLTGAQVVALGKRTAGVMGSDEFRDRVAERARAVGENGWAMPLPDELRSELDSRVADITNVTGQRWAGMLVAGVFLREFVAEDVRWAHIDVAGPAYNNGSPWGYTGKGGTGVPVRTVAAVLADIAENG